MGELGGWVDGEMAGYVAAPFFHKSYTEFFFFFCRHRYFASLKNIFIFLYLPWSGSNDCMAKNWSGAAPRRAARAHRARAARAGGVIFVFCVDFFLSLRFPHRARARQVLCVSARRRNRSVLLFSASE